MAYLFGYDDPYALLAYTIVGYYRPADVARVLYDDQYLEMLIRKETRIADIGGSFLDCIIEDILEKKQRMEYMHALDELSKYYYSKLDVDRLRAEVVKALGFFGLDVPSGYSTAGNASSATA